MLHLQQEHVQASNSSACLPPVAVTHPSALLASTCHLRLRLPVSTVIQRVLLPRRCVLPHPCKPRRKTNRCSCRSHTHSLHQAGLLRATSVTDTTCSDHTQSPSHTSHTTLAYVETLFALSCRLTHPSSHKCHCLHHTAGTHPTKTLQGVSLLPALSRLLTNHSCWLGCRRLGGGWQRHCCWPAGGRHPGCRHRGLNCRCRGLNCKCRRLRSRHRCLTCRCRGLGPRCRRLCWRRPW